MNWYKLAFPLLETPENMDYLQIGHEEWDDNADQRIWFIFIGFEFRDFEANGAELTHRKIFDKLGWDKDDILASGRYFKRQEDEKAKVSVWLRGRSGLFNDKIMSVLDEKYDNPDIYEFK